MNSQVKCGISDIDSDRENLQAFRHLRQLFNEASSQRSLEEPSDPSMASVQVAWRFTWSPTSAAASTSAWVAEGWPQAMFSSTISWETGWKHHETCPFINNSLKKNSQSQPDPIEIHGFFAPSDSHISGGQVPLLRCFHEKVWGSAAPIPAVVSTKLDSSVEHLPQKRCVQTLQRDSEL